MKLTVAVALLVPAIASAQVPANVTISRVNPISVGVHALTSSSRLKVTWSAPDSAVDHYRITALETVGNTRVVVRAGATETSVEVSGLKASTPYAILVSSCLDAECADEHQANGGVEWTDREFWQLVGTGNTVSRLTRIVSDGNARLSATRFGPEAGESNHRIQLYYGPFGSGNRSPLATAPGSRAPDAASPDSYLSFTSRSRTTGLLTPDSASRLVRSVATGQGVPLSQDLGGKVRLFFEAEGADGRTRVMSVDSHDGYIGQDFNPGASTVCATAADYENGCLPTVAIGVDGDADRGNARIRNARQFKLAWPTQDDWRWDGAIGRFMVFTTDQVTGCSTSGMNHGYAVWDGARWNVQYAENGCPKLFTSAQAAFPMHVGGVRYKLYYGDPSITTGRLNSMLPFLGPKKLIYADGSRSALPEHVDFEDWEAQTAARDVVFLWPNGDVLDATAEGYIDDWHFLAPTGDLNLQVMYLTITDGGIPPFAAAAILRNP